MSVRYLGVDWGAKRIGLALGDAEGGVVCPLKMIHARPGLKENARAILQIAEEYDAAEIVIGLPLNMDGTEGPQAKLARSVAEAIRKIIGSRTPREAGLPLEVHLHDERLTSHAANERLAQRQLTHKKKKARHDAVAAQILLQSFVESRRSPQA